MSANTTNGNASHSDSPRALNNRMYLAICDFFTLEIYIYPRQYLEARKMRIAELLAQIRRTLEEFAALDYGSSQ